MIKNPRSPERGFFITIDYSLFTIHCPKGPSPIHDVVVIAGRFSLTVGERKRLTGPSPWVVFGYDFLSVSDIIRFEKLLKHIWMECRCFFSYLCNRKLVTRKK